MKSRCLINVIIVTYNAEKFIQNCLNSLLNQTYNKTRYFITIIDNASCDETINIIKRFSNVKLISNKKNFGFAKANNVVLKLFDADCAILLNQDSVVDNNFIDKLVEVFEKDKSIVVCGGAEHPYDKTLKSKRKIEETNWVGLGATMLRMNALKKVNFLDENYFMYNEDIDLCWRLKFAGYKIYYTPFAIWHHYGFNREISKNDKRIIYSSISRLYLLFKFASFKQIFASLKSYLFRRKNNVVGEATTKSNNVSENRIKNIVKIIILSLPKILIAILKRNEIRKLKYFNRGLVDKLVKDNDKQVYG